MSLYLVRYFFLMHSAHFSDRATFYYAGPSGELGVSNRTCLLHHYWNCSHFKKTFFSNAVENNRFDKYC